MKELDTSAPLHLQAEHKAEVTRELSRSEEKWGQRVREVEEEGRYGFVLLCARCTQNVLNFSLSFAPVLS